MKVHSEPAWMQSLPNLLTGLRVVLTPVIVCLMLWDGVFSNQLAAIFFGVAAISDVLDGFFARRHGSGTQLGIFFDLVGDKLLVAAVLIAAVELRWIPGWVVVGFVGREMFVMGMRSYAGAQGVTVSAGHLGKMKMMWQYIAIGGLLWDRAPMIWVLVLFAFVLTIVSGIHYLITISRELQTRPAPDVPDPI
ncbi:MAG: CDP-diacylglycerol--glycerol-3-phosphate 3-phosphatidyltransferase [Chloroflexi bacterium]|nr:CDP-diacylglycerol--glycerol-3-phosphate 3-phosphatidyltransferase [Chloroflexota bacterium]HCU73714.1 CDP-diacylglycerol--glycerol-3-phosphate 3-phosphatidyltransferase [Chloroflexota bacterium]|tara:strand:- start:15662 stop:16237 length:576 start_codon:yes stop_codon:yes gene_type:complete